MSEDEETIFDDEFEEDYEDYEDSDDYDYDYGDEE